MALLTPEGITFGDGTSQGTTGIEFPSGTVMIFRQTSAPTGWAKDTTNYNDHTLRVVTGTIGSGGSVNFSSAMVSKVVSGSVSLSGGSISNTTATGTVSPTTLNTSQIPAHNHSGYCPPGGIWLQSYAWGGNFPSDTKLGNTQTGATTNTGSSGSHTHSVAIDAHNHTLNNPSASFTGTPIDMAVKYCDIIFATKS